MKSPKLTTYLSLTALVCAAAAVSVQAQVVIPATHALPKSVADLSKPGFIWNVHQVSGPEQPNNNTRTETQLAGGLIDPNTSQPFLNIADPNAIGAADGVGKTNTNPTLPISFDVSGVINFSQAEGDNNGNATPDLQMPGIPGIESGTDSIAAEVLTWLELEPGTYTMIVNSDDGFKAWIGGATPQDRTGVVVGEFSGGRGASDTLFSFTITQAGLYAARTTWEEGGGGANVEWLTVVGARRVLINDTNNGGIKAYRAVTVSVPAYLSKAVPSAGPGAPFDTQIDLELVDGSSPVVAASVKLFLDEIDVTGASTITKTGDKTTIRHNPNRFFDPSSTHTVRVDYNDGAAKSTSYSFTVANYITLTADLKVTPDLTKPGFLWRVHQQTDQANDNVRPERQLAGLLGPNLADAAATGIAIAAGTPDPDPNLPITFEIEGTLNLDQGGGGNGAFTPDDQMPGIPGTTGSTDGIAAEILYYLDLPTGVHTLIVNSDDGFRTTAGSVRDVFRAKFGGEFSGGRGAADTAYKIRVVDPGVYAFRTIWEEGGGGANIELVMLKADGTKVLLNDTANGGFASYRAITTKGLTAIRSVSPGVNATGVLPSEPLRVVIQDGQTPVDTNTIVLTLDGAPVSAAKTKVGDTTTVTYQPSPLLAPGSSHTVAISFNDAGTTRTETWGFVMATYGVLTPAMLVTDANTPGFVWRVHQVETAQANSGARAESQLRGELGANVADPNSAGPASGPGTPANPGNLPISFRIPGVVNMSQAEGENNGNFTPDSAMPGIPGLTGSTDNIAAEVRAFIDLPAGLIKMVVNSDDGFVTSAGFLDTAPTQLGVFEGGRGASDTVFEFVVQAPGVYGFRTIWYEGNGGANFEWLTIKPDGTKVLLNDTATGGQATFQNGTLPTPVLNPTLSVSRQDGVWRLTYTGTLQSATKPEGPYTDVPTASSPYSLDTSGPDGRFFRTRN